ncbi:MAG: ABC transporter permease [Candidatus Izimaplasma sp.]|nr:ABC transporter permease [Candidatus Izimaplasma bacterium]
MHRLRAYVIPYRVWMTTLIILPSLMILFLAITDFDLYLKGPFVFTLEGLRVFTESTIQIALMNSIKYSLLTTIIALLIGYPAAYYLANLKSAYKTFFVALIIIPVWSNMLLRIIAWEKLFFPISILNNFGISLDWIGSDKAIVVGMLSMYFPFMILPIYSVLVKLDQHLIEAARDLGANGFDTFVKVILPLSLPGIVSGVIMTLLPAMTTFALPERLGGGKVLLIGNIIEDAFMKTGNLQMGSIISVVLMIIILILFKGIMTVDKEGETLL